tara:strand:+ start:442 stop:672 length:231 start_codon:yes stop_codon:yes gene_type:complete
VLRWRGELEGDEEEEDDAPVNLLLESIEKGLKAERLVHIEAEEEEESLPTPALLAVVALVLIAAELSTAAATSAWN